MKHVYAVYHIHKLSEQNNVNKSLKLVHGLYEVKNIKISVVSQVFHKTLNEAKSNYWVSDVWKAAQKFNFLLMFLILCRF